MNECKHYKKATFSDGIFVNIPFLAQPNDGATTVGERRDFTSHNILRGGMVAVVKI